MADSPGFPRLQREQRELGQAEQEKQSDESPTNADRDSAIQCWMWIAAGTLAQAFAAA